MNLKTQSKKLYLIYAVLSVVFTLVNVFQNETLATTAFLGMIVWLIVSKAELICLVYFLIPNINIMNVGNFAIPPINTIILLIGIKYLFTRWKDGRQYYTFRVNYKVLIVGLGVLFIELFHANYYQSIGTYIFNMFNITFDIMLWLFVFYEGDNNSWKLYSEAITIGVVVSFVVSILADPTLISYIFASKYRLEAYANDPNYYSMYVLIGLISLLKKIEVEKEIYNYLLIILLTTIGLLTSSKMCIICMAFVYLVFVISSLNLKYKKRIKFLFAIIPIGTAMVVFMWNKVSLLIQKVILRFSIGTNMVSLDTITSGRSTILKMYINRLREDKSLLWIGKGIDYNIYLSGGGGIINVAHNTYFDIVLSWGIIGTLIFCILMVYAFNGRMTVKGKTVFDFLGIGVVLLMLLALSCFSADMFWYLIALCLLPLKKMYEVPKNEE